MAVGVAASLLLLQPRTLPELILGAGAAAVGSVISDIDCGTSESSRRADQIIFVSETIIIGIAAVEAHWHLGLYQRLMSNSSVSHIVLACAAFLRLWKENTTPLVSAFLSCRRSADELCWRIPSDAGAVFWDCFCISSGA